MIDRNTFIDSGGRFLTQSIFLEFDYNTDLAVYTAKDYDHEYNGKLYPSLKRLYLQEEDPTEYIFANKHLAGWPHWQRLCDNKWVRNFINQWREELEIKLRAQAVRALRDMCNSENGNFQAAKFLADRGWDKRAPGRPSKAELEKAAKIGQRLDDEFTGDVARMEDYKRG